MLKHDGMFYIQTIIKWFLTTRKPKVSEFPEIFNF